MNKSIVESTLGPFFVEKKSQISVVLNLYKSG